MIQQSALWIFIILSSFFWFGVSAQVSVSTIARTGNSLTYEITVPISGQLTINYTATELVNFQGPFFKTLSAGSDTVEISGLIDSTSYAIGFLFVSGNDSINATVYDTTLSISGINRPSIDTISLYTSSIYYAGVSGGFNAAGSTVTNIKGYISIGVLTPTDGYHLHTQYYRIGSGANVAGFWIAGLDSIPTEDTIYFYFTAENHIGIDTSDVLAFSTGEGYIRTYSINVINGGPTGIADRGINHELSVYPNPSSRSPISLNVSEKGEGTLYLIDVNGKIVHQESLELLGNPVTINLPQGIAGGLYQVKLKTVLRSYASKLFIQP